MVIKMKRANKGATLIEFTVTLAIVTILTVVIGGLLFSSLRIYYNINDRYTDKLIGDGIYEFISRKSIYAEDVIIINSSTITVDGHAIRIDENGRLLYDSTNIFGDDFYKGRTVAAHISEYADDTVNIDITVYNNGESVYTTGSVVKMLYFKFSS